MADYQLELRQVVDYPRCRIYREFMQTLIADRSIRTGGCSGLFYYVVLCAYANFRTSYRRIDGISYTVYPGEWICSITDITEWFRVRFHYQAFAILKSLQDRQLITFTRLGRGHIVKFSITIVVVDYKGYRVAIPLKEMMLYSGPVPYGAKYKPFMERMNSILATMLTAEIDFIVRGLDNTARSVVASRKAAMLRKRQTFYLDTNEDGVPMIYEGRVVQARVIGVAEKVLRVEVFGVECTIFARDLSAAWFGDAREYYSVGDRVLVRVLTIDRDDINHISITTDIRSVSSAANQSNLDKCVLQGKYAGRVTDVRHGVVFIRLNNGVNAVAHTCYDRRMPGKKDDVSFAVTRLDEERGIAVGIITRIIKQNL